MEEAYRQARKRGEQGRRRAISQSEHPYLTDLDSLVAQLPLGQRENVGLRDIPLEMVVGTVTKGRQSAFSCNFMPLLPFSTEFARKWSNLYDIQVTEGYRDPVIVTEFMHRFYVQEGNKRVRDFLTNAVASGRASHAYLFLGAPGAGKLDAAWALAQAFLCEQDGCGSCDSCVRVARHTHPDVHYYTPESATGYLIAQTRELLDDVPLAPIRAKAKVYIIDRAEQLRANTANAPVSYTHLTLPTNSRV